MHRITGSKKREVCSFATGEEYGGGEVVGVGGWELGGGEVEGSNREGCAVILVGAVGGKWWWKGVGGQADGCGGMVLG